MKKFIQAGPIETTLCARVIHLMILKLKFQSVSIFNFEQNIHLPFEQNFCFVNQCLLTVSKLKGKGKIY